MPLDLYSTALIAVVVVATGILSIRFRITSAVLETVAGIFLGSFLAVRVEPWLDFLGTLGGLMLTFLAGTEMDLDILRKRAKPSLSIGTLAFGVPLVGEMLFLSIFTDWSYLAKLATSLAMTATAVVVVYTILLEHDLLKNPVSGTILAVIFVNDILTLMAVNSINHNFNLFTLIFIAVIAATFLLLPKLLDYLVKNYGGRSVELELRFIFAAMLVVSFLSDAGHMQAVFGAFILGLVFANSIHKYRDILPKIRSLTFTLLSPAFFIRAGLLLSLPAVIMNLPLIFGLLGVKMISKFAATYSLTKVWIPEAPIFCTLLLSTGLTIGIITATFCRDLGFLNQNQFSVAVVSVILSAIVPTYIARIFTPKQKV